MQRRISCCLSVLALAFILFTTGAFAAPVQWAAADGGNDHWYEIVRDTTIPYITWTEARHAAEAATFNGMRGHLATLTSQAENDFVGNAGFLGDSYGLYQDNVWIGGYQYDNHDEPAGHWAWVTGEAWNWTHWYTGEPNGGDYLRLGAGWFGDLGYWFDQPNTPSTGGNGVAAYIIEYQAVPVPAAVWMLGSGLLGLLGLRRKIKG